jgi:hypothetical protein
LGEDDIFEYAAVLNNTVIENLRIMYPDKCNALYDALRTPSEGAHFIDRFCQYVVLVQCKPVEGLSMKMSDYGDNVDTVIDEYKILKEKGWDMHDINKISELALKIREDKKLEKAEIVIKDRFE